MNLPYRLDVLSTAVVGGNTYAGSVYRWVDGDTVDVLLFDPIVNLPVVSRCRVMVDSKWSVNCPDRGEPGYREVTAAVAEWLPPGRLVVVTLFRADKYAGRVDAAVATAGGESVAEWLLEHGYAVRWDGTGSRPLVPWPPSSASRSPSAGQ